MSTKPTKKPIVKVRRYTLATIGVVATVGGVAGNLGSIIDLFDKFINPKPSISAKANSKAEPSVNIAGTWQTEAEVRYDWGDKYIEFFKLKLDGNEVRGTASYLGYDRAVLEGEMVGDKISFITRTRETLNNNQEREVQHKYRGTVSENEMKLEMHSTGGFSEHLPIEFTVKRTPKP